MINIVVVFPKTEDGKAIKNLLVRNGYDVTAVCTSGAQAMNFVDEIDYGVIICGYKFNDMLSGWEIQRAAYFYGQLKHL